MKSAVMLLLWMSAFVVGCGKATSIQIDENSMVYPMDDSQEALVPPQDQLTPNFRFEPLSWESAKASHFKWSNFVFNLIDRERFGDFDKVTDAAIFCPKYSTLNRLQKINFWGALVSGMVRFESNYRATTRMMEPQLGYDSVTGRPAASEGLMQLSYSDAKYRTYCQLDWHLDSEKADTDPTKTIFDPYLNLDCGVKIFADQIGSQGKIATTVRAYWSVLKPGHSNSKINEIAAITKQLTFCN